MSAADPASIVEMKGAVTIPALNEEASVGDVVSQIIEETGLPVWLIDDCSTDATAKRAALCGARVIKLPEGLGAWGAAQTGIREAARIGLDFVVTMDADGQHNPSDIKRLIAPAIGGHADVVIGACPQRASRLRKLALTMIRKVSGIHCEDLTSGFRVLNRQAIHLLSQPSATLIQYQDVGILSMCEQANLRILEVPVQMPKRINGKSRIFGSWLAVTYYMAQTLMLSASKRSSPAVRLKKSRANPLARDK